MSFPKGEKKKKPSETSVDQSAPYRNAPLVTMGVIMGAQASVMGIRYSFSDVYDDRRRRRLHCYYTPRHRWNPAGQGVFSCGFGAAPG